MTRFTDWTPYMKRFLIGLFATLVALSALLAITAARFQSTVKPNVFVGSVPVGGLSFDEAARKVRIWWEAERINQLELHHDKIRVPLAPMTPGALGVMVDDLASVKQLPFTDFVGEAKARVQGTVDEKQVFDPKFKPAPVDLTTLQATIRNSVGDPRPATVSFVNGQIVKTPEVNGFTLDKEKLFDAVVTAVTQEKPVELPLVEAPKKLSDEQLAAIKDVVSEFSTRFPASNRPRCANIKLAQSKINGLILLPGESFSYNETVGPRTIKAGFQLAGVYKNGRHDTGIGGGICQVSTTLYNAALFANLPIKQRLNHSMPVPYVPVGRDATVNYGAIDLAFTNTFSTPIAIAAEYLPGKLTFRILGTKDPSITVKITSAGFKSFPMVVKTVKDPTLPVGKIKVIEKDSAPRAIRTFREVYQNGVKVRTDSLGVSHYPGGQKIVAVGTRPPVVAPVAPPVTGVVTRP